MNENLNKSIFLTSPAVVLGVGLIAPLMANASPWVHLYLGGAAMASLTLITIVSCLFTNRLPYNSRIPIAIVLSGGTVSAMAVIGSHFFNESRLPVETIVPLLMVVSIMALHTEAYDVKKPLQPALIDAFGIGILFLSLLILCGLIRDLALRLLIAKGVTGSMAGFFHTLPGIFLVVCLVIAGIVYVTTSAGWRQR
ncbi:MAG: hypothetical protein JXA71_08895 [Chitinispirillaceae bacterium]|nr:hypothetical protein [Chitinispirillaceae bacterium]